MAWPTWSRDWISQENSAVQESGSSCGVFGWTWAHEVLQTCMDNKWVRKKWCTLEGSPNSRTFQYWLPSCYWSDVCLTSWRQSWPKHWFPVLIGSRLGGVREGFETFTSQGGFLGGAFQSASGMARGRLLSCKWPPRHGCFATTQGAINETMHLPNIS